MIENKLKAIVMPNSKTNEYFLVDGNFYCSNIGSKFLPLTVIREVMTLMALTGRHKMNHIADRLKLDYGVMIPWL